MDSATESFQPLDGAPVVEGTRGAADKAEAVAGSVEPLAECRKEMMEKLLPGKELGKKISPKKGLVENIWPMEEMGNKILNKKKMAPTMLPKLELEENTMLRLKMGKKT